MLLRIWNYNSRSLLVGMQNGSAALEESLAVSYKMYRCNNYTPCYLHKEVENLKLMST